MTRANVIVFGNEIGQYKILFISMYIKVFGKFVACMKHIFLFFLYISTNVVAFAQLPSSASKFYRGDETPSKSIYDSLTQKWKVTEYHSGGIIASEEIFEKDGITPTDTLKAYFIDG